MDNIHAWLVSGQMATALNASKNIRPHICLQRSKTRRFRVAFEFFGCMDHGCRTCTNEDDVHPRFINMDEKKTIGQVRKEKDEKLAYAKEKNGDNLKDIVVMWQCEFENAVKERHPTDLELQKLFDFMAEKYSRRPQERLVMLKML